MPCVLFQTIVHWTAVAIMAAAATAVQADQPSRKDVLAPSSKWNVEFSERSCMLRRAFGEGVDEVGLRLERFGPGDKFQLVLAGKRLTSLTPGTAIAIRYGVSGWIDVQHDVMIGEGQDGLRGIIASSQIAGKADRLHPPPPVTPEEERAVTEIGFSPINGRELVLQTGPLDKVFATMRRCTDELLRHWGLDPVVQAKLSRQLAPANDVRAWVTPRDYSRSSSGAIKQTIVTFRIAVNEKGRPESCSVLRSFGNTELDDLTCNLLMRRARFVPALDDSGSPIASYYTNSIRYWTQ